MAIGRRLIEATALLRRWLEGGDWETYTPKGDTHLEEDTSAWLAGTSPGIGDEPWRQRLRGYIDRDRGEIKFRVPHDLDELIAEWQRLGGRC